jgi:hypothetical protein
LGSTWRPFGVRRGLRGGAPFPFGGIGDWIFMDQN